MYDETPSGRPLPTLQQIRQANLRKIFEEEGANTLCDTCGDPRHDYRNCTKKLIKNPKTLGRVQFQKEFWGDNAQTAMFLTQEFAPVHGVTNLAISPKIVWLILQIVACGLGSLRKKRQKGHP